MNKNTKFFINGRSMGLIILALGKSFWRAILSILTLIVYSVLLFVLLNYYKVEYSTIETFVYILKLLIENWGFFFFIFFISNLYDEWRWREKK